MKVLMIGPDIDRVPGGMATVIKNCIYSELANKVELKYISSNIEGRLLNKLLWNIGGVLKYLFNINRYDIVHIHMAERGSFYRKSIYVIIAKILKKKSIIHFHGAEFDEFYSLESNKIQKKYISYILDKSSLIIALGELWQEKIKKYTNTKIVVLSNAVEVPINNFYNLNNRSIILLGRLEQRKGTFDLLDIADNILCDNLSFNLVLAGDGNLDLVKAKIKTLKFKNNIKLLGWINKEQREELFKNTAIFVLPSYNEGMPMAILEAMSYGIPVVVSDVGDIPYLVKDYENGYLIKAGDKKLLENRILKLIENDDLRIKISRNNYKKVKDKFNLQINLKKLEEIYRML
mgnify:CR=1 FL=1